MKPHVHSRTESATPRPPRIALVADVPNWAWDNIAHQLRQHLQGAAEIEIFYHGLYERHQEWLALFALMCAGRFDLVHFFWRDAIPRFLRNLDLSPRHAMPLKRLKQALPFRLTTSVYDHLFLTADAIAERRQLFADAIDGYTVSSQRLNEQYRAIRAYPAPAAVTQDGVDRELFRPANLGRLRDENRPLKIGWAGNSAWGVAIDGIDHKGFHTLIKPAVSALQRQGLPVLGHFCDRVNLWVPHREMVHYYNSIDIYVCASDIEGTATPVIEAMACGIPIVSTDVGIVPEVIGPLQRSLLVNTRSVEAIAKNIGRLVVDPDLRCRVSKENLEQISRWTPATTAAKYRAFFQRIVPFGHPNGKIENRAYWPEMRAVIETCLHDRNDQLLPNNHWAVHFIQRLFGRYRLARVFGRKALRVVKLVCGVRRM